MGRLFTKFGGLTALALLAFTVADPAQAGQLGIGKARPTAVESALGTTESVAASLPDPGGRAHGTHQDRVGGTDHFPWVAAFLREVRVP
ncbi:hypothetical protein [uncultured Streptomyces sp.]|uniref:hypothetical protein n=1 Tax=uncultured Streptomyces sp. TaxID=174707 RepID=UPI002623E536|nr:hypothetical protein [uncultured Streptomyces sp.]